MKVAPHTVTREQYHQGRRTIIPSPLGTTPAPKSPVDVLIDAPYPRVDLDDAVDRALAMLETPP